MTAAGFDTHGNGLGQPAWVAASALAQFSAAQRPWREARSLVRDPVWHGRGVGAELLDVLMEQAASVGVRRVFCLTFEVEFFSRHGFRPIDGTPVAPDVYAELLRSADEGVAEFLDLARVKPNTLGNTRMLREL